MKKQPTGEEIQQDLLARIGEKYDPSNPQTIHIHPPMDKHIQRIVMKVSLNVPHFSDFVHKKIKRILCEERFKKITHVFFTGPSSRPSCHIYNDKVLVISGEVKDLHKQE